MDRGARPRRLGRAGGRDRRPQTATIAFQDVYVPEEQLLRELNRGFSLIMANFRWERLLMALGSVGGMASLLERAVARARLGPNRRAPTRSGRRSSGRRSGRRRLPRAYGEPMLVTLRPPEAVQVSFPDSPCELENLILQV
ncbi:MAG: acyl-CoA dehydrogenase family protein [Solirubrobacteraceae bacterium]